MLMLVRSPVKVVLADSVASVFSRFSIVLMLLRPPSMICSVLTPSLAFSTPWVSSAMLLRVLVRYGQAGSVVAGVVDPVARSQGVDRLGLECVVGVADCSRQPSTRSSFEKKST